MTTPSRPWRIGLTGGIGSGKSTVARSLVGLGATLIDTDAIARELTQPGGAAIAPLREAFGANCIDAEGALDRSMMRGLAFTDPTAKARLEAILHPLIGEETRRRAVVAPGPMTVFDVPLLVESGRWRSTVDRVWVVDCRESTQVDRVITRSGWREDEVRSVLARQASRAQRRAAADTVIYNDDIDVPTLQAQVLALWRGLVG
jgi:dephospho-CoA kinase